jgi:3-phosphoshikimate 1-carboxyvinyltransferase
MSELTVVKAQRIAGEIKVSGDKSISHRAVLISALSNGTCVIRGFLPSQDCLCTVEAMRSLGIQIEQPEPTTLIVHGERGQLRAPEHAIDCGNSGTLMRLLTGLVAAHPFETELVGDESLSQRPMNRVVEPLTQMGAQILASKPKGTAPLRIRGGRLRAIRYELPVASGQVKSAILLAGLSAKGKTVVVERSAARDHTERMLNYFLVRVQREPLEGGSIVSIYGDQIVESRDFTVPGDVSSAAFWLTAAAAQPEADLLVRGVGLNETRTGFLSVLLRMGARVREVVEDETFGEPEGQIRIQGSRLHGTVIEGAEIPNLIDELPILAVAAALAEGKTVIRGAAELRVKETDRLAAIATNLIAMGVDVVEREDGLEINGGAPLLGGNLKSFGDHRIAMAFAIAGLFAEEETIIQDTDCISTSYPGFEDQLQDFLAPAETSETPIINPAEALERD